jgi:hypothetical protein
MPRIRRRPWAAVAVALAMAAPRLAAAQAVDPVDIEPARSALVRPIGDAAPALAVDGPEAPLAPAVINRDARGNATVRAVRLTTPLQIDGRLDEEIYLTSAPIRDLIQQVPREGAPATEPTEIWVFFDDRNLFISVRNLNSEPDRVVATEMRRDTNNIFFSGDSFTVVLDTLYDRRNGYFFQTNPLSAVRDQALADGQQNGSWNTVWETRSTRSADAWSAEMAIPFKSLRYRRSGPQVWGINFRRSIRWKNEISTLTPVPASYGNAGIVQLSFAGSLVGVETPAAARNLEIKPYAVSAVGTDLAASTPFRNDMTGDVGVDVKYGLTPSLVADVTVNTDFAQVEEDIQQVNLTRFSLFFPEKRDFFLEGQGIFAFGGRGLSSNAGGGDRNDVPVLFFSRQIGLSNGQAVPVIAGGRITGKAGPFDVGLLDIQTAEERSAGAVPTNFSAVRLKRDVLRRSSIGMIATGRRPTSGDGDSNLALGADAAFRFFTALNVIGYYARTWTPGVDAAESSYRGVFDYAGDRYGLSMEHLAVGGQFNPEVGFLRRDDFRRTSASVRFSPRLRNSRWIRKLTWQSGLDYITDADVTRLENRSVDGSFGIEFHSGDMTSIAYAREYELLPRDFGIATGVTVPKGGYSAGTLSGSHTFAQQRRFSGRVGAATGSFYEGTKHEASYSGRLGVVPQFALEPSLALNWVSLPYGEFTARVISNRFIFTPTPLLMLSSLVQYNSSSRTLSSSIRFRWEYAPGSDVFVVYTDGRDTARPGFPDLLNRSFAVKATRLIRF